MCWTSVRLVTRPWLTKNFAGGSLATWAANLTARGVGGAARRAAIPGTARPRHPSRPDARRGGELGIGARHAWVVARPTGGPVRHGALPAAGRAIRPTKGVSDADVLAERAMGYDERLVRPLGGTEDLVRVAPAERCRSRS